MRRRHLIHAAAFALAAGTIAPALASEINRSVLGTAIEGYDPVAYFAEGRPVEGSSSFAHEWQGAVWHFASEENRDRFAADPEAYAPQYGGYCAWAVAHGYTAPIDPNAWHIADGRLFLNYNLEIREQWLEDVPRYVADGDANWPGIREELAD